MPKFLKLPNNIQQALNEVFGVPPYEDDIEAFASRWKGWDIATMQHVLQEGQGDDRVVAIFALGYKDTTEAREAIVPFLESPNREERWASALCLGSAQDQRTFSHLQAMLLEGLVPTERVDRKAERDQRSLAKIYEEDWCDAERPMVVKLLEAWQTPSLIPLMRKAFQLLWELQTSMPYFSQLPCQDELAYALGQRGAFGALVGLNLPPLHWKTAVVYMALGTLSARERYQGLLGFASEVISNKRLQQEVAEVLERVFGLAEEERRDCIDNFYWNRSNRRHYNYKDEDDIVVPLEDDDEDEEEEDEEQGKIRRPKLITCYTGHLEAVTSVAWSPNGKYVVSGSDDSMAHVWDAESGRTMVIFQGHTASVNAVEWSPDGRYVASGGSDNTVYVWQAMTGEQVCAYRGHQFWILHGLAWSPDGKHIASGSWDGTVQLWDALTGETLLTYRGHEGIVYTVAWSPDGRSIASGSGYPECLVQVWDAATGETIVTYREHQDSDAEDVKSQVDWKREPSSVHHLAWSPDGRSIVSVGERTDMHLWEAMSGKTLLLTYHGPGPVRWSTDGTTLMMPRFVYGVELRQAFTDRLQVGYELRNLLKVDAFAWSPNHKRIVATGNYPAGGERPVCVWRL